MQGNRKIKSKEIKEFTQERVGAVGTILCHLMLLVKCNSGLCKSISIIIPVFRKAYSVLEALS